MHFLTRPATIAALAIALALPASWAGAATDSSGPASVVTAFNEAITAQNIDKMASYLAPGGVQFMLRAPHSNMEDMTAGGVGTDLQEFWALIGSTVVATTTAYSRNAEIIDSQVHGDIATVWVKISTVSQRKGQSESMTDSFTEIYLMVHKDGKWLIGAIADNRQPNPL